MRLFVCFLCLLQLGCATTASRAPSGVLAADTHRVCDMNFGDRRIVTLTYAEADGSWEWSDMQRQSYGVDHDDALLVVILRDWPENAEAEVVRGEESSWLYVDGQPVAEAEWPVNPDPYLVMSCEARRRLDELAFRYRNLEFHVTCKRRVIDND